MKRKQKGMSLIEYTIGVFFILYFAFFFPVSGDGRSAIQMIMDGIKDNHEGYIWSMSLPT